MLLELQYKPSNPSSANIPKYVLYNVDTILFDDNLNVDVYVWVVPFVGTVNPIFANSVKGTTNGYDFSYAS